MATLLGSLLVSLGMESAQFKRGAREAESTVDKMQRRMQAAGVVISAALTGAFAAVAKAAVDGAVAQRQAVAQVEAALTSMGGVAQRTSEQLVTAADEMELRSLFDADVILKQVTANLLTFGNVAGEQFDRAQQAAIDMATRLGGEPQAAAIMLGKALNDPIKGITALTRVGVQFTEQQKAQIAEMQRAGDTAGAQSVILREVERQFRGAAQAAADNAPYRQFQVILGQIGDTLGEALLPGIISLRDWVSQNREEILRAAQAAVDFGRSLVSVVGALTPLVGAFVAYRAALLAASAAQAAYTAVMVTATRAIGAAQAGTLGLNAALAANPFGAVAVAVGVLAAAFIGLANAQAQAKAETDNLITSLKAAAQARSADFAQQRALLQGRIRALETPQALSISERVTRAIGGGAFADAARAEDTKELIRLRRELVEADKAYAAAGKAAEGIVVPTGNATAAVSKLGGAAKGAGGDAKTAADGFQSLYDRLFPYQAMIRQFDADAAALTRRLSGPELQDALRRLENERFAARTRGMGNAPVSQRLLGEGPLVDLKGMSQEYFDELEKMRDKTRSNTVTIAESFAQMSRNITSSLQGLANSIRSGDILGILGGVLDIFTSLGSAGVFGRGLQTRLNRVPGNANGTRNFSGGLSIVGERGPELVNLPRRSQVIPNHKLESMGGGGIAQIVPSPYFDVVVDGRIVRAAPAVAGAGAQQAMMQSAAAARRRVR